MAPRTPSGRFAPGASGNPSGRPPASRADAVDHAPPGAGPDAPQAVLDATATAQARADGWTNLLAGFGVASKDKRLAGYYQSDVIAPDVALDIWRGDPLAARIVETVPNEMLREGFCLSIKEDDGDGTEDRAEVIENAWEDLGLEEVLREALCYERGYGGGAIMIGANDGQADLTQPLAIERVQSVEWLTALEARDLTPVTWYTDPGAPKFGRPATYRINPVRQGTASEKGAPKIEPGVDVHESRFVIFPGITVSRRAVSSQLAGWGDTVLTRVWAVLRDFNMSWSSAAVLVHDFAQAVFGIKGLSTIMSADNRDLFVTRMQMVDLSRSTARAVLIDAEGESFKREATPVTGLPDLLDRFATLLAAAADMPLTLLMGQSPAGLNATGESDIRFFYDRIRSAQRRKVAPAVRYITRIMMQASGGVPKKWGIKFNPLWQPTAKEQAEARKIQADTDAIYLDRSVVDADEVTASRFAGAEYSFETHVDLEERAKSRAPIVEPDEDDAGEVDPETGEPVAPAQAKPGDATASAPVVAEPAKQAMNGAQVASMIDVVSKVGLKEISRESGIAILTIAFPITAEQAAAMLPEDFKPEKPEPPPSPFGGGGGFGGPPKPKAPAPPADDVEDDAPPEDAKADRMDRVEQRGSRWVVLSMEGKVLGEHDTEADALAQLRAVEAAKHRAK